MDYREFVESKTHLRGEFGFDPIYENPHCYPFQHDLIAWALRQGRGATFADCGLGKTLMQLVWAENVHRRENKPVLILAPLSVSSQTVEEAEKFGIEAFRSPDGKWPSGKGIITTNYERLHYFSPEDFAGVVCDECFPPDTPVDIVDEEGEIITKHIKNIAVGDMILNASGVDRVSDIHRREVQYAVKVNLGGSVFICSPNHPIFTQRGWVGAQCLQPGDKALATEQAVQLVRFGVQTEVPGFATSKVLRDILLSEMADGSTGTSSKGPHTGSGGEARQEAFGVVEVGSSQSEGGDSEDNGSQSNGETGGSGKNLPPIESHEARTFRAWGEWSWADGSAGVHDGCSWRRLDSGICYITGPTGTGISDALQAGPSRSGEENRRRGGWSVAPQQKASGPEEGCEAGFVRVDSIEVLERGHPDLERYRDAEGKLYFYDLGGTRHPSFSVCGVLVHNSSILKNFDGAIRSHITHFMRKVKYRAMYTATPSPNDYTELGTSSEALGDMAYMDMLSTFFKSNDDTLHPAHIGQAWRFKGHAEPHFWRWVASWARAIRRPSDLGFDDGGWNLPDLIEVPHLIKSEPLDGQLFAMPVKGLPMEREERKATIQPRCELAAELLTRHETGVAWCHFNAEADLLAEIMPGAVNLSGADKDEAKEEKFRAFRAGQIKYLVTKPKIAALGVNWQHCNACTYFDDYSYEQYYQAVRRFWRFGQKRDVTVHQIGTTSLSNVAKSRARKAKAADKMFEEMMAHMVNAQRHKTVFNHTTPAAMPAWI